MPPALRLLASLHGSGESAATLAHRMGEGLGVRDWGEVFLRFARGEVRVILGPHNKPPHPAPIRLLRALRHPLEPADLMQLLLQPRLGIGNLPLLRAASGCGNCRSSILTPEHDQLWPKSGWTESENYLNSSHDRIIP